MSAGATRKAQIRRLQDTLIIIGSGVIAFGAWTLAKVALAFMLLTDEELHQLLGIDAGISLFPLFVAIVIVACVDLGMRVFVGLSARAEGQGKRKGLAYLIVAVLIAMSNAFTVVVGIMGSPSSVAMLFDAIVTTLIDATSLAMLVLMMSSAIRLRRLTRAAE